MARENFPAQSPLLKVSGLSQKFEVSIPWLERMLQNRPRQWVYAVEDVSFEIAAGKTFALVGESGCGKSTVARLLVGLQMPSRGEVWFAREKIAAGGVPPPIQANWRRDVQMIFQDPYASLNPRWRVVDILVEPLLLNKLVVGRQAAIHRAVELMQSVGLSSADLSKFPHQFSGGQRQRISIARALATKPKLLVCDEPTSALDVSVQAQVLNLMKNIQADQNLTCLFISHNLAVVRHMADEVGVMYLGRLVERASKRQLFASPRHPYTRMLLDAIPDLSMSGRQRVAVQGEVPDPLAQPSGCAFHPRCPLANRRCQQEMPAMRILTEGNRVACHAVEEGRDQAKVIATC